MRIMMLALVCSLSACTTAQSSYTPLASGYAARPDSFPVEVFRSGLPDRKFIEVAELDVHLEATHFIVYSFNDAEDTLKDQARQAGGDAVINIDETKSRLLETSIYHVTATAIRYTDN